MDQSGGNSSTSASAPDARRWLVLALLGSAFLLVLLDGTIVYVALPRIQRELGFTIDGVQWVVTSYLLCFGGLLLLGGRLAAAFGTRRMFLLGIGLLAAASLACGLAPSPGALVAGRAVQGIGAAIAAPAALPLLATTFPPGPARGRALRVWTAVGALAGTVGLLVGGPLTDGLGWRWVFLVNVPVGLVLVAASPVLPRNGPSRPARRRVDLAGAVTLTVAVVLLAVAISGIGAHGWATARTVGLLAASASAFTVWAIVETRAPTPLLPLRALRSRTRLGGVLVLLVIGVAVDSNSFLLTVYTQQVLDLSATRFGVTMTVMTLSAVVGSLLGQAAAIRSGLRTVALAGLALIGIGFLLLTGISVPGDPGHVVLALTILGPGVGAAFVAGQIAVVAAAPDAGSLATSGLADASYSIGGGLGLVVLSTVAARGAATEAGAPAVAVAAGLRTAFAVAVGFAVLGIVAALVLLRRSRRTVHNGTAGDRDHTTT